MDDTSQAEEARFQTYYEFAPIGTMCLDPSGQIRHINRAGLRLMGLESADVIGREFTEFLDPHFTDRFKTGLAACIAGEGWVGLECVILPASVAPLWIALDGWSVHPENNDNQQIYFSFRDITLNKQVEEGLRESEDRYSSLFIDNNSVMLLIDPLSGKIEDANPAACVFYGYTHEEICRLNISQINNLTDEQVKQEMARARSKQKNRFNFQHRLSSGKLREVEVYSGPITVQGKKLLYSIVHDVSENKRAEQALEKRAVELETLIQVSAALRQAQTTAVTTSVLLNRSAEAVSADIGVIFLFDGKEILLAAQIGYDDPLFLEGLDESDPFFKLSFEDNLFFIANVCDASDFKNSIAFSRLAHDLQACIAAPLKTTREMIGLLFLGWFEAHPISHDEERLLTAIMDIGGSALQRTTMMEILERRVIDRTRELSALYDVAAIASEDVDLNRILEESLQKLLRALHREAGAIHLLDDNRERLLLASQEGLSDDLARSLASIPASQEPFAGVLSRGELYLTYELTLDEMRLLGVENDGIVTYLGMPIRSRGREAGILSVITTHRQSFTIEDISLLGTGADQIGMIVENVMLRQQAEQAAIARERERLARELHDSVTQSLYSLTLFSEVGQRFGRVRDFEQLDYILGRLSETAQQALKEMRLLVYELRPTILDQDGLIGAISKRLESVEKRAGIQTQFTADDSISLPFPIEEALYRIAQEGLNNALKHARASSVSVNLSSSGGTVTLEIVDNGIGFNAQSLTKSGGMGLVNMRERAEKLGGTISIQSGKGMGTTIRAEVKIIPARA